MKRYITCSILCSALIALCHQLAFADDQPEQAPKKAPLARLDSVLATVTATVESIDLANREVTLKGPLGNTVTFVVDKRVKRLNEVKVGDIVKADYYLSVAAELREPTAEETKTPLVILAGAEKAGKDEAPAAGGFQSFKVVTTIEGLDRPTRTVTVKGPRGNYLTARVEDPSNLTKMRIGDTIVITYTEALAISLEKVSKTEKD